MEYEISNQVQKIAHNLIKQYHPELGPKKIICVTQARKDKDTGEAQAQMRKGKPVLADMKIVSGLNAFLVSGEARTDANGPVPFAVLVVSKHAWNALNERQREAMIDEQLCRLLYDDESGRPAILDYDVAAFTLNVKRFGAWHEDLEKFLGASSEFPLFKDLDEPKPPAEPGPTEPVTPQSEAQRQVVVLKGGNGKSESNGSDKEEPKPNGVAELKNEVARRRGGARVTH